MEKSKICSGKFHLSKNFTPEIHNKWMQTMVESGQVIQFIIWERISNKKIGSVYLRDIDYQNKKLNSGFSLVKKITSAKDMEKLPPALLFHMHLKN